MEMVKGVPITDYCDARELTVRQRVELFIPVCQAVQHAHQKAILHRDLKPSNILITEVDGKAVPKVIDFGIAKALGTSPEAALQGSLLRTQEGLIIGTPQYMSPEQASFGAMDVDTRSDIYTLGVILYELLTGQTPLSREQLKQAAFDEVLRLIREDEAKRPSSRFTPRTEMATKLAKIRHAEPGKLGQALSGDLDWIVLKALEKDRSRRYETANALAQDLQRHLRDEPVSAGPPGIGYRLGKFVKRNRTLLLTSVAVTGALAVGGFMAWRQQQSAVKSRESGHQLSGFMMRSLVDKLESVGRLELIEDAAKSVRSYYESLPAEQRTPEMEESYADVLEKLSRVYRDKGDLPSALQNAEQAAKMRRSFTSSPDGRRRVAESLLWLSTLHEERGNIGLALKTNDSALDTFSQGRLAGSREPAESLLRSRLEHRRSVLAYSTADAATARTAATLAIEALEPLIIAGASDAPGGTPAAVRLQIAKSMQQGEQARVAESFLKPLRERFGTPLEIVRSMMDHTGMADDARLQYELAVFLDSYGRLHDGTLFEAEKLYRRLSERDPANQFWKRQLCQCLVRTSYQLLNHERFTEAGVRLDEGLAGLKALWDADPENLQRKADYGSRLRIRYWQLQLLSAPLEERLHWLDEGERLMTECVQKEPGNALWQVELAWHPMWRVDLPTPQGLTQEQAAVGVVETLRKGLDQCRKASAQLKDNGYIQNLEFYFHNKLSDSLKKMKSWQEALKEADQAVAIKERFSFETRALYTDFDSGMATALGSKAGILFAMGMDSEAKPMLLRAIDHKINAYRNSNAWGGRGKRMNGAISMLANYAGSSKVEPQELKSQVLPRLKQLAIEIDAEIRTKSEEEPVAHFAGVRAFGASLIEHAKLFAAAGDSDTAADLVKRGRDNIEWSRVRAEAEAAKPVNKLPRLSVIPLETFHSATAFFCELAKSEKRHGDSMRLAEEALRRMLEFPCVKENVTGSRDAVWSMRGLLAGYCRDAAMALVPEGKWQEGLALLKRAAALRLENTLAGANPSDSIGSVRDGFRDFASAAGKAGQPDIAKEALQQIPALYAKVEAAKLPITDSARLSLAVSLRILGTIELETGAQEAALGHLRESGAICEDLLKRGSKDDALRISLGTALHELASYLQDKKLRDDVMRLFTACRDLREKLVAEKPDDLARLANLSHTLERIAGELSNLGKKPESYALRQKVYDIRADLLKRDASKPDHHRWLGFAAKVMGDVRLGEKKWSEALAFYEEGVQSLGKHIEMKPDADAYAQVLHARCLHMTASLLAGSNDPNKLPEAVSRLKRARDIMVALQGAPKPPGELAAWLGETERALTKWNPPAPSAAPVSPSTPAPAQ